MIQAPVNKIIPYSVVDGPGNRTSIFLQGCNLRCAYCHNPETQSMCIHCGICVKGCPTGALTFQDSKVAWEEEKCIFCDQCINVCPYNASPRIHRMTPEEVFAEVKKNIPFIRGITVSGGECTLYPDFLLELFILAKKEKLTCLIDTNGMVDLALHSELVEICDGVMLDIKSWDTNVHEKLTGSGNVIVKKNLRYLADKDKIEELRIVCVSDEVDAKETVQGIADMIGEKAESISLKLIKFRNFGVKGRLKQKESPDNEYMEELHQIAIEVGFRKVKVI